MPCFIGRSESDDRSAYSSVEDAESPSTPSYDCSNAIDAENASGLSCANLSPRYPVSIRTPLSCMGPDILTSRSMFTMPLPMYVLAVMRDGLPNEYPPRLITERPLTWPTNVSVDVHVNHALRIASRIFSSSMLDR